MLSDEDIESAAEVVATALERFGPKTRLAQGLIAVAALEDAGYIVEKLDPGPPDLGDHLAVMLKASLSDGGMLGGAIADILQFPGA